jgi:glycosyltransferase involved in cell wall biosynthesis
MADVLWQRKMLDGAALLHYTTEAERDLAGDLALKARSAVIPLGIEFRAFATAVDYDFRRRLELGEHDEIILFLGRISHKKGLELLISAMAEVRLRRPIAHLVIAGPDDEGLTEDLIRLAVQHGIADRVRFVGMLTGAERLAALQQCDVWILPSKSENFGIAVIEAMAAGAPVVLSPQVNLAAEAEAAGAALVVPRDSRRLASALGHLLDDAAARSSLADGGQRFARQYDWQELAPRLAEMYSSAACSRSGMR